MPDKSVGYAFMQQLYNSLGGDSGALAGLIADDAQLKGEIAALSPNNAHVPTQQDLTAVPTFSALAPHPLPCWAKNGVCAPRNSAWRIDNTAAYTINAGTAFATGADLKASTSYSVVIMQGDGSTNENTLVINSTGKSLSFTADQTIKAASFVVFICEEYLD